MGPRRSVDSLTRRTRWGLSANVGRGRCRGRRLPGLLGDDAFTYHVLGLLLPVEAVALIIHMLYVEG